MLFKKRYQLCITILILCLSYTLTMQTTAAEPGDSGKTPVSGGLWARQNLFAWGASVDSHSRSPEDLARMLERLGFTKIAYGWETKDIPTFDEQIEAFKRHGIEIIAWSIADVDDPAQVIDWNTWKIQDFDVLAGKANPAPDAISVSQLFALFKRHNLAPQLWLIRRMRSSHPISEPSRPISEWTDEDKNRRFRNFLSYDSVTTQQEQALRVEQETKRIKALADLAALYNVKVALYKHGGWIGISKNQVAIMERLKTLGVANAGIVYQFIHAHDEVDDTADFSTVWKSIQPYVLAVNITGIHRGRNIIYPVLYPSQGDLELEMLRTIQDSGWKGPIGLSPEKGGATDEVNLRRNIIGLDWIAAELLRPGSAGPRPLSR